MLVFASASGTLWMLILDGAALTFLILLMRCVGQAFITQQIKGPLLSFVSFRVWYFNLFKFLGTSTQMILEVAKSSQSVVRVDF
jgi:sensor histidine kinase YesM